MTLKHLHKFYILTFAFFILSNTVANCQLSGLEASIDKLVFNKSFKQANISFSVYDVASNKEIAEHRSDKVLSPASSLKLFTTLSAIHYLGAEYRYRTVLGYTGKILEDGTLEGDLIVRGSGDPTLGSDRMEDAIDFKDLIEYLVLVVQINGITCINGDVIIDESIFDSYPVAPSWQWNDLGNYYASGAWGVNINENQYFVYFKKRNAIGTRPYLHSIAPKVPNLKLSNELLVDSSHTGDQAYIFGGPYNYDKRIVGTIPQGESTFSIKGSIPDPPVFLAYHLKNQLAKKNIQSNETQKILRPKKLRFTSLDTIVSPPLSEIVRKANLESNNLYTEAMLKTIGLVERGQGSGQNGLVSVKQLMRKCGAKTEGLHFHDGSGLSARNLISSKALAGFLSGITKYIPMEEVINYLPKGGHTGTVRGMFSGSPARGQVWLKSGSMEGVQSYSGYVKSKSGAWRSFSIIVNGFSDKSSVIRSQLEKLITAIYKEP